MPHFPSWRPVFGWHFAVLDNPPRTSLVNKCRDTPREPPGSGIIGSFRSRALSAFRNCRIAFQGGSSNLPAHWQFTRVPVSPHSWQRLVLSDSAVFVDWWMWAGVSSCLYLLFPDGLYWPTVGFPRLRIAYPCALSIFLLGHLASSDVCVDGVVPIRMQLKHSFVLLKNVAQFWFSHWHL